MDNNTVFYTILQEYGGNIGYADNAASILTIEHYAGRCIEQKPYADNKPMLVYQIEQ